MLIALTFKVVLIFYVNLQTNILLVHCIVLNRVSLGQKN